MATKSIAPDQDAIELDIQIAAPPDRVFRAISDPTQLLRWWGQPGLYHCTTWTADVRPGGQWRCEGVGDSDGRVFHVKGEYLEVEPPRLLVHSWIPSFGGDLKTVVRWQLKPAGNGTHLTVRHSGFTGQPESAKGHYEGWIRVLGWMQEFVEKGTTVPERPSVTSKQG
jgi:uncharacterized protein YndB with AHSA1/START domain